MQKAQQKKINVLALYAGFQTGKVTRRITPIRFQLDSGDVYHIRKIRRTYTDRVGNTRHIHFVLETKDHRFFDIVYDSEEMLWYMVVELEEELFFSG